MTRLCPAPLTAEDFAPFGHVIAAGLGEVRALRGGALQLTRSPAALEAGAAGLSLVFDHYDLPVSPLPLMLETAERHARTGQLFAPLPGCGDWLCVVWPGGGPAPSGSPRAFRAGPGQAVIYAPGIWHAAIVALSGRGLFLSAMWRGEDGQDVDFAPLAPVVEIAWR